MTSLRDAGGAALTLGKKLGSGGEGEVFRINEHPRLVAKIYAKTLPPRQVAKLEAMVRAGDDALRTVAAWPTGILHTGTKPVGFTMPLLEAQRPLHELFGPKSRQEQFPNAHWKFLIHTGRNLARAFTVLHERNVVVGDVNSNNIVVCGDATAHLIDCDSFQFPWNGSLFRCNVGVADYQPPELQHGDLSRIDRLPQHDVFGLAVIIFQLLFVGKHPFAGVLPAGVTATGAIGANVAARRFFYAREARQRGLRPPPGSPTLGALTPLVAELFTQAFLGEAARRPSAANWYAALEELEGRTVVCDQDPAHRHVRDAACPWCALERQGLHYFLRPGSRRESYGVDESVWERVSNADVERLWAQIASVRAPRAIEHTLAPAGRYRTTPAHLWTGRRTFAYAASASVIFTAAIALALHGQPAIAALLIAAGVVLGAACRPDARAVARRAWKRESDARRAYSAAARDWEREAKGERFAEARERLAKVRAELLDQRRRYSAELADFERNRARREWEAFIGNRVIAASKTYGIDERLRAYLRRRGIVTAAHVTRGNLRNACELTRHNITCLLAWRESVEREFRIPRRRPSDAKALREIKLRHVRERTEGWSRLTTEAPELGRLAVEIERRRPYLQKRAGELGEILWQAEADAKISPLFYKTWT